MKMYFEQAGGSQTRQKGSVKDWESQFPWPTKMYNPVLKKAEQGILIQFLKLPDSNALKQCI